MNEHANPYKAPRAPTHDALEAASRPRSFQPSDRSWRDLLMLLGIGLAVAFPAMLVIKTFFFL